VSIVTPTITRAQQHIIIDNANIAVARIAKCYTAKRGLINLFTKEDIEDIACNTICKAWRSFASFNPDKAQLSTWVSRIAVNCVIDAVDYKIKHLPISGELFEKDPKSGEETGEEEYCDKRKGFNPEVRDMLSEYDAEKELSQKEFETCVKEECSKLSEKNQRFERWLEEGYTPKEMAAMEGCTADAAAKRLWFIRKTLKKSIGEVAKEFGIYSGKLAG
jgi:RNA polymerase sigma factor (sigma-70 family)